MIRYQPISESNPLVLASVSPRRKAILTQIGIPFVPVGSNVPEAGYGGMNMSDHACQIAVRKAESARLSYKGRWILGADTLVAVNRWVFGKPRDTNDCRAMLLKLSGKRHRVMTGFCVIDPEGSRVHLESVMTRVKVKELSDSEIESYIRTGEPFGKAGAYAIQGIGSFMIERIDGSYTNVVGLPVCEVVRAFVGCGALRAFPLTLKE
jgi:septum formation protein